MNILFASPYYNNSHFIKVQIESFKKYLKNCSWKLLVIDDSNDNTINALSGEKENILEECLKYGEVIYKKFSQSERDIPKRHRNVLNFMFKYVSDNYKNSFDYFVSFDADMCFIKDFDVKEELEGYDIIGPKRIQWLGNRQCDNNFPIFDYMFVHCMFINLKTVVNFHNINLNCIPNTTCDTGSMMLKFLLENSYKIKFLEFSSGSEILDDPYYFEFFHDFKIIHFSSGTLWVNDNNRYKNISYKQFYNIFVEFIKKGISNEDLKNLKNSKEKKYGEKHKKFVGRYVTEGDFYNHIK